MCLPSRSAVQLESIWISFVDYTFSSGILSCSLKPFSVPPGSYVPLWDLASLDAKSHCLLLCAIIYWLVDTSFF